MQVQIGLGLNQKISGVASAVRQMRPSRGKVFGFVGKEQQCRCGVKLRTHVMRLHWVSLHGR